MVEDHEDIEHINDVYIDTEVKENDEIKDKLPYTWNEVEELCHIMENVFQKDGKSDIELLRDLQIKQNKYMTIYKQRKAQEDKKLQFINSQIKEWELKVLKSKKELTELSNKLMNCENHNRETSAQLKRNREDHKATTTTLQQLKDEIEHKNQESMQFSIQHQDEIPIAKHELSLHASITGIKWDLSNKHIAGDIYVPEKQEINSFEVPLEITEFEAINAIWEEAYQAFDS